MLEIDLTEKRRETINAGLLKIKELMNLKGIGIYYRNNDFSDVIGVIKAFDGLNRGDIGYCHYYHDTITGEYEYIQFFNNYGERIIDDICLPYEPLLRDLCHEEDF